MATHLAVLDKIYFIDNVTNVIHMYDRQHDIFHGYAEPDFDVTFLYATVINEKLSGMLNETWHHLSFTVRYHWAMI